MVATSTAMGTFFSGFSTASAFAQADSSPRNAHRVTEIELPTADQKPISCGFHAADQVVGLNQNQPISEIRTTGRITPHTVIEPILPVMLAPPKLANVVTHSSTMVQKQVCIGLRVAPNRTVA